MWHFGLEADMPHVCLEVIFLGQINANLFTGCPPSQSWQILTIPYVQLSEEEPTKDPMQWWRMMIRL
jgi:hypothetical protein